jgi:drug/metabolite transporter (DMT)-like permease
VSPTAIVLVLIAAVAHATWNLYSKQASAAGAAGFVWLMSAVGLLIYAPVAALTAVWVSPRLSAMSWLFMAGTGALHTGYFLLLLNGYRLGDLSQVYPVGRGTGALLAALAGIVILGERPGPAGIAGIMLIVVGVIVIGLPGRRAAPAPPARAPLLAGLAFALATGVFIGGYTLWDKYAVATLRTPAVLQDYASLAGMTVALAVVALRDRPSLGMLWHHYRPQVVGAAVLSPLAYILVLAAMSFTAVSAVAPAREVSVLIGVLLGRRLLGEGAVARRLAAAAAIVAGIIAIAAS